VLFFWRSSARAGCRREAGSPALRAARAARAVRVAHVRRPRALRGGACVVTCARPPPC
jgi:hypothetical protein